MTEFFATRDLRIVIEISDEQFFAIRDIDDESIDCWTVNGKPDEIRVKVAPFTRIGFLRLPHHVHGHTCTKESIELLHELEDGIHGEGFGIERVRVI